MGPGLFDQIRHRWQSPAFGAGLYSWSLRAPAPERLIVKPVDPWPGNIRTGAALCEGVFIKGGDRLELYGPCWQPLGISPMWLDHLHGFSWLRDLRAFHQSGGGEKARKQAQALIADWAQRHTRWDKDIWRPDLAGQRVSIWIALYEFFGATADESFQDLFFESLGRQALHLSRALPGSLSGEALLQGAKGLLYAGLAFEGREAWIEQALDIFSEETDRQVLGDGCHVSRSPTQLLNILQIFLDVRSALSAGAYPLPEKIQHAIDRMGPALRFFRYNDRHFGVFNGAQEGDAALIDVVLGQTGTKSRILESLPCAGYERISMGRTFIMFDGGAPPGYPYDAQAHAAPLSFEFCYGKERVFVNCGSHPVSPDWIDALRATAAHNTLGMDYRNAFEIRSDGHFGRKPRNVLISRENAKQACLIEASHDGYVPLNGMTHRRRLYVSDQGQDIRGEDLLSAEIDPATPHDIAVRFHLHPRVLVSLICDGQEALLRLPGGSGWRFRHGGGYLALEDSLYLGQGCSPRKTKQLVIYAQAAGSRSVIKWALRREGT